MAPGSLLGGADRAIADRSGRSGGARWRRGGHSIPRPGPRPTAVRSVAVGSRPVHPPRRRIAEREGAAPTEESVHCTIVDRERQWSLQRASERIKREDGEGHRTGVGTNLGRFPDEERCLQRTVLATG